MKRLFLFFSMLTAICLLPKAAIAFSCSGSTTNIPVTIKGAKIIGDLVIIDMSTHSFTCSGITSSSFQDAIRISTYGAHLNSELASAGYVGFFINSAKEKFTFDKSVEKCIWPDAKCSINIGTINKQLPLEIGLRKGPGVSKVRLLAGTEIVKFEGQQRGNYGGTIQWGSNKYMFKFILQNDFILPVYTCNVDNADNIVVKLPQVDKQVIQTKVGRYDGVSKKFDINLTCDPETSVDVTFSGDVINGRPDVLSNTNNLTSSVGIQVVKDNEPIVFGNKTHVIDSAQEHETLTFEAYYFYNGGILNPGQVKSLATVTFDYQ